jgi:hypothetical protein
MALILVVLFAAYNSVTAHIEKEPNGTYVKNGSRVFYQFLKHVKETKSVIILGTSETGGSMDGRNYWGLLDKDADLNTNFYSFGGAGRCSYVYFPLILNKPKAFENLNLLVYLNPTYWRKGLNNFSIAYYERYVSSTLVNSIGFDTTEAMYKEFIGPGAPYKSYFKAKSEVVIDDFKSHFYYDLNVNYVDNAKNSKPTNRDFSIENIYAPEELQELKDRIDTSYNASFEYVEKNNLFPIIDTASNFQTEMLKTFIEICKSHNIKVTFYLGPVNEVYCMKRNPELIESHHKVVSLIRGILETNKVSFIDGSEDGRIPGTFKDVQHISQYGAYLTALRIKEYYEKGH